MDHAMEQRTVLPVDNETKSTATRTTKEGKTLTYSLNVLQQPQRARACGAGAKSSADRRPVDPPPIVELKIYEGENQDRDITFNMNANYFLFTTLEHARPMAHGRMPEDKTRVPVLTGTPVAGMVYLDRPSPAGYFIFPDLSVRHEGKYRLSFSLFEELKDPKDHDRVDDPSRAAPPGDAHVTHRLEVKSQPFMVYSAKKFPGLTESTHLSRMVAEQGCRVRIRRDVRMRRRDTKKGGTDWDSYDDAAAEARARVSATPESAAYPAPAGFMDPLGRPRSASNVSHHSLANPLSRRPSMQDMASGFHPSLGTAPHTPQSAYAHPSPYDPAATPQYPPPPYLSQQSMHPPVPQYSSSGAPLYHPPPPMPASSQQNYYGGYEQHSSGPPPPPAPVTQPQFAPPPPPPPASYGSSRPPSLGGYGTSPALPEPHRPSAQYASTPPPPAQPGFAPPTPTASYPSYSIPPPSFPQQTAYGAAPASNGAKDGVTARPPPLQPVQPPARANGATTPLSGSRSSIDYRTQPSLPPLHVPTDVGSKVDPSPPTATPKGPLFAPTSTPSDLNHKRSFGNSFPSTDRSLNEQPLRQGARPTPSYNHFAPAFGNVDLDHQADNEGDLNPIDWSMAYKRADGSSASRTLQRRVS